LQGFLRLNSPDGEKLKHLFFGLGTGLEAKNYVQVQEIKLLSLDDGALNIVSESGTRRCGEGTSLLIDIDNVPVIDATPEFCLGVRR
jgi:hypothetical protein